MTMTPSVIVPLATVWTRPARTTVTRGAPPLAAGDRPGPQEKPRLADVIVGVDRHRHAGPDQGGGILLQEAGRLQLAAGAVDQGQRAGDLLLGQLDRDAVALGGVLQDQFEAEL